MVQIAEKFPKAKEKYLEKFSKEGWRLCEVQFVNCGSIIIANCATQYNYASSYGFESQIPLDYDALKTCMEKVRYFTRNKHIAIPKIGAGLAKGEPVGRRPIFDRPSVRAFGIAKRWGENIQYS